MRPSSGGAVRCALVAATITATLFDRVPLAAAQEAPTTEALAPTETPAPPANAPPSAETPALPAPPSLGVVQVAPRLAAVIVDGAYVPVTEGRAIVPCGKRAIVSATT